jgi:hypothetical protein
LQVKLLHYYYQFSILCVYYIDVDIIVMMLYCYFVLAMKHKALAFVYTVASAFHGRLFYLDDSYRVLCPMDVIGWYFCLVIF